MTKYLLGALLLAAAAAAPRAQSTAQLDAAPRITMPEFRKLLAADRIYVIDVRGFETYKLGHIPGSHSVPLDELNLRTDELKAIRKPIVVYCA